ncbi:hypothetical protein ACHAWO_010152 [Cyclotella atomus]|uniref:CRC domain-containing protein n=1 Tax=Cyclotella atomus TaxID=382360 RepID=A0ABD3Q687_9STRA
MRESTNQSVVQSTTEVVQSKQIATQQQGTGCKCKKATCLVKFCECVQARTDCGASCKCFNCGHRPSVAMAPKAAPTINHSSKVLENGGTFDGDVVRNPSMSLMKKGTSDIDGSRRTSFAMRRLTKSFSKRSFTDPSKSKHNLNTVGDTSIAEPDQTAAAASILSIQTNGETNLNSGVIKMSVEDEDKQVAVNQTHLCLEQQRAKHQMQLEQEKEDAISKMNKLEADMDNTILDYETKILDLALTHSIEMEKIKNEKDQIEDKLAALQDEHVWTSAQLALMENELLSSNDAYESQMKLEKQKSMYKLEQVEEDKNDLMARASKLEEDIDTTIQEYESRIGSLTMLYSDEINNLNGEKESLVIKLTTLQDEYTRTNQQLQSSQNELIVKTSTYETHIKMLESQLTRSEERMQQKIKALEKELESMRAYQSYSNPMISRALPESITSSQTKQGTSDEASLDSEVVVTGFGVDSGDVVENRGVKTHHIEPGEDFVDMNTFDDYSLSSACSSTSYDA